MFKPHTLSNFLYPDYKLTEETTSEVPSYNETRFQATFSLPF